MFLAKTVKGAEDKKTDGSAVVRIYPVDVIPEWDAYNAPLLRDAANAPRYLNRELDNKNGNKKS